MDYMAMTAKTSLRCSYAVEQLLLVQSVEGHAHGGHGQFHGKSFANTTLDDISRALRLSPIDVKSERQALINEIRGYAERAARGKAPASACNEDGEPLLRCGVLRHIRVDPKGVLIGLFLGGLRDGAQVRRRASEKFGVKIGYGKCHVVDRLALEELGLDGRELASEGHEQELDILRQKGVFTDPREENAAYMYVRYQTGPGASDDLAIAAAGRMLGVSAAVGCFLADAVDTIEKYATELADQDEEIARMVEKMCPDLGVTEEDAVDLAYLCSIPEGMDARIPDSSLRHLLEVDRTIDQCAVESHLAYSAGMPFSEMELDRGQCTNVQLYKFLEKRLEALRLRSGDKSPLEANRTEASLS